MDNEQAFAFGMDGDKFIWVRENMSLSRSTIFKWVRLQWKLRFQDKGEEMLKIDKIGRFLTTTLKRLGNCQHKGWCPQDKYSPKKILAPSPTTKKVQSWFKVMVLVINLSSKAHRSQCLNSISNNTQTRYITKLKKYKNIMKII